tara:strand:- start:151 stop:351 length:201 start_codon:yes stop_codon:yes gene_type:complete
METVGTMTDSQFELFMMHGGMMSEGLKSEEALAFILRAQLATAEDIAWLVDKRAKSAAVAKVATQK